MLSQPSQGQLEHEFCRDFDRELERANLSLSGFHKVLLSNKCFAVFLARGFQGGVSEAG